MTAWMMGNLVLFYLLLSLAFTLGWSLCALMGRREEPGVHDLDAAYARGVSDGVAIERERRRADEVERLERWVQR